MQELQTTEMLDFTSNTAMQERVYQFHCDTKAEPVQLTCKLLFKNHRLAMSVMNLMDFVNHAKFIFNITPTVGGNRLFISILQ